MEIFLVPNQKIKLLCTVATSVSVCALNRIKEQAKKKSYIKTIELVWSILKNRVAFQNVTYKNIADVTKLIKEILML